MEMLLKRQWFTGHATTGEILVDGAETCFTLELPTVTGAEPPRGAIPAGEYTVRLTKSKRALEGTLWSPEADGSLPLIEGLAGHEGLRMHAGNTVRDTIGCTMVGEAIAGETLVRSRKALTTIVNLLRQAHAAGQAKVALTIVDEPHTAS